MNKMQTISKMFSIMLTVVGIYLSQYINADSCISLPWQVTARISPLSHSLQRTDEGIWHRNGSNKQAIKITVNILSCKNTLQVCIKYSTCSHLTLWCRNVLYVSSCLACAKSCTYLNWCPHSVFESRTVSFISVHQTFSALVKVT